MTSFTPIFQRPQVASINEEDDKENDFQLFFCSKFISISRVFALLNIEMLFKTPILLNTKGLFRAELKK